MEVKETAACGISQREFAVEFDPDELPDIFRILRFVLDGTGFYDEDFLEDLKAQMAYIVGPSLEEAPPEEVEDGILHWEDDGGVFNLFFNEEEAGKLAQILSAADHPGEGLDRDLDKKLMEEIQGMAPSILDNLPVINR